MNVEEEARKLVDGDRNEDYGDPYVNHYRTSILMNAYLKASGKDVLTHEDVCYLNIMQKIARDMHRPKRDNVVDIIGWALNIAKLRGYDTT